MSYSRISTVLLVGAIAAGLTACGPSKVDQCNSLITSINKVKPLSDKFDQDSKEIGKKFDAVGDAKDPAKLQAVFKDFSDTTRTFGTNLDGLNKEISGVSLKDETLTGFKNQYLQTAASFSQEISTMTATTDTMSKSNLDTPEGLAEFQKAVKNMEGYETKIDALTKQENETVDKLNTYCK